MLHRPRHGTAAYMAPEMSSSHRRYRHAAHIATTRASIAARMTREDWGSATPITLRTHGYVVHTCDAHDCFY